jgi:hypothetical protein
MRSSKHAARSRLVRCPLVCRRFVYRRFVLGSVAALTIAGWSPARLAAATPEDVFKGRIIVTAKRLPTNFPSANAFIAALKKASVDRVWPTEQKGNDHAVWNLEYIAFFAQALGDNEVMVKFFDVTPGAGQRYVAGDEQYTREKGRRIFASNITLSTPDFSVNKRYMMTVESGRRVLARTTFWLRGKGPEYTGKVEFSDEEAKQR